MKNVIGWSCSLWHSNTIVAQRDINGQGLTHHVKLLGVTYTVTYGNRLDLRLSWLVDRVVLSRKARMNKVWRRRKGIVDKVKW